VTKNPSGLLVRTTREGNGEAPAENGRVRVRFTGTTADGTVFESSDMIGGPTEIILSGAPPCWQEGLRGMRAGGSATLYCPADLAFGDRGRGSVAPGATVIFEIELLEILE